MNLVVDESVDRQIVARLRQDGHLVRYVAETAPGISDDAVLELANAEGSLLVTADKDFGELVFRQRRLTSGIVLIRLAGLTQAQKAELVARAINKHASEFREAFAVITPAATRIRGRVL